MIWKPLPALIEARITKVSLGWLDTPYLKGQAVRRMGCDCVHWLPAIYAELFRMSSVPKIPRLKGDFGVHSSEPGLRVVRALLKAFPCERVFDGTIEPGDCIGTRSGLKPSGPNRIGHGAFVSATPNVIYQALPTGIKACSLESLKGLIRVYRPLNKEVWA